MPYDNETNGTSYIDQLKIDDNKITLSGLKALLDHRSLSFLSIRNLASDNNNDLTSVFASVRVRRLDLEKSGINDDELIAIAKITEIKSLYMSNNKITDVGLLALTKLPNKIYYIALNGNLITDTRLSVLRESKINYKFGTEPAFVTDIRYGEIL